MTIGLLLKLHRIEIKEMDTHKYKMYPVQALFLIHVHVIYNYNFK